MNEPTQQELELFGQKLSDHAFRMIAALCHNVNRLYRISHGQDDTWGDWHSAPEEIKQSAINGVKFHLAGNYEPEMSHQAWVSQKVTDGWTYGPVLDKEAKQHPNLVSFEELPLIEQMKDHIFKAIVDGFKYRPGEL